jgi:hypothetical protein
MALRSSGLSTTDCGGGVGRGVGWSVCVGGGDTQKARGERDGVKCCVYCKQLCILQLGGVDGGGGQGTQRARSERDGAECCVRCMQLCTEEETKPCVSKCLL